MGQSILKHIVDGKELFLVWSSIVDAPVTYGCTKKQLLKFWKEEYGRTGIESLELRWDRSVKNLADFSDLVVNRAGKNETQLTVDQIVDYYYVRKGKGPHPVGASDHETG